ncbi:MAG: hypothetical protein ACXABY_36435 [Candidatus Thorarchaeota archaeon]|jgi:uncharacterized protein YlxW (UPF0749 family)
MSEHHDPENQFVHTGDKSIVITSGEIVSKALWGLITILIAIVGFIGVQLWAQVQTNTSHNAAQDVEDAKIVTELKSINTNIDGLRRAIEGLIAHDANHQLSDQERSQ